MKKDNILVHMHITYLARQLVYREQFLQSVILCSLKRKKERKDQDMHLLVYSHVSEPYSYVCSILGSAYHVG